MSIINDPDGLRWAARTAQYGNRVDEDSSIRAADESVFNKVSQYEQTLVNDTNEFREETAVHLNAAEELETALREEVRFALDDVQHADTSEIAGRYQSLRAMAAQAIAELEKRDRHAAWMLERLDDPYSSFKSILGKYGNLLAGRGL